MVEENDRCCSTIMRVIKRPPKGTALKPPPGIESLDELGYREGEFVEVKITPIEEIEAKSLIQAKKTKSRLIKQRQQDSMPIENNIFKKEILDMPQNNKEDKKEIENRKTNILDDLLGGS